MSPFLVKLLRMQRLTRPQIAWGSRRWSQLLKQHNIDVRKWSCEPRDGGLFFPALGTTIPGPGKSVLLSGFHRAVKLHANGVRFSTLAGSVRATVGPMSLRVDTTEELLILEEIYLDGVYHFEHTAPL